MEQTYLYILLFGALPLIVGLTIAVLYYRYRLNKCMVALCRCISEISDLKQKLIKLNVTYDVYGAEITPQEFVRVVRNMLQKLLFLSSFFLVVGSAAAQTVPAPASKSVAAPYTFALRANLLRWATLTPDLGIEWRINRNVGILVNGSWTSWSWDDKNRRYALWEVNPEVRWYLGRHKNGYVGALYKVGEFNYKFSGTGKQGDLMGGGITGGYQLQLNRALSMDFTLGLGYVNADVEKYTITDGVRVRQGKETKHWFGPVQAGVTLVWRFGK